MTLEEAITEVVGIIPSERVTEFDEVLETIRTSTVPDTSENWEKKYSELEAVYKKRFVESLTGVGDTVKTVKEEDKKEEKESVDIKDLDFSADTE